MEGTSLAVQWLRLCTPDAWGLGSIPGLGTRSHMPQLRPSTAKYINIKYTNIHIQVAQMVKESVQNVGNPVLIPGSGIPWRREWQPTPVFLPGEFHGQMGYSSWGRKELEMTQGLTFQLLHIFI